MMTRKSDHATEQLALVTAATGIIVVCLGSTRRYHGQILHPMPFYLIFGFSDFPKIRKMGTPENPDFLVFRNFGIPNSENPDFRESKHPDFRIFGISSLRKSGFPEIRKN